MKKRSPEKDQLPDSAPNPFRVTLPRFVSGDEEVGLGDVIKRAASTAGIRPCDGCGRRTSKLNNFMVFSARKR